MAETEKTLNTGGFSQITGIAVSTITQMLRLNKIRGEKRSGKWAIYESELQHSAVVTQKDRGGISASVGPIFQYAGCCPKSIRCRNVCPNDLFN